MAQVLTGAGAGRPAEPGLGAASQARLSPTAVIMSVAHRSSSTTCHAAGAAARISATGSARPGADRGHRVVAGHRTVLDVQVPDPLAEPPQQRGHVLPGHRGPVRVHFEQHRRVERGGQGLQGRGPVRQRGELVVVVVVAEAQALAREPGRGGVKLRGHPPDAVSVGEPGGRQVRHDTVSAPSIRAAAARAGLLASQVGVPAADRQARRGQVGGQPGRVAEDVERFRRSVTERGDLVQDAFAVHRELVAHGVELQGRRVAGRHVPQAPVVLTRCSEQGCFFFSPYSLCSSG